MSDPKARAEFHEDWKASLIKNLQLDAKQQAGLDRIPKKRIAVIAKAIQRVLDNGGKIIAKSDPANPDDAKLFVIPKSSEGDAVPERLVCSYTIGRWEICRIEIPD